MPEAHEGYDILFQCSALAPGDLFVRRMHGREALSNLFEFELLVETTFGGALEPGQLDDILHGTAYIAFGSEEEHKYHGVVRQIEMLSMSEPSPVFYRIKFVPKVYDLIFTSGSWIYQDMNVPEIIKDVMQEAGFADGTDFELRLTGNYKKREYVVQYQETDLNFIQRWMEHEGIFYFFEHGDDGAKMVMVDANNSLQPLASHETIPYEPRQGITALTEPITALSHVQSMISKQMKLRDYNYRTPSVALVADADVDSTGVGHVTWYGDHFKDLSEGKRYAKIRAQELLVQKNQYRGGGKVRGLRSGHKFTLENHLLSALDQEYVVVEMTHSAVQTAQSDVGDGSGTQGYTNEFLCIPYAVQYRAPRVTPKAKIYGVINAKIDAAADNPTHTPVDDQGRYKCLMPFDIGGEAGGRASRWVRMAQSASGGGYGMHFPLHAGTEVLLIHVDGDPDRPMIVGSVPNPETVSPVTAANAQQHVLRSRNGIVMSFDDSSA